MKKIMSIFTDDIKRITSNVASIIIVIGLVVIPGLFTWFNVAACWDPFANTKNLKFAIANQDEGYKGNLLPMKISVGDQVINSLRANSQLDWTFTSQQKAIDGTKSGKYYAAVVIPKNFSKSMMTFLSSTSNHATLDYYTNEKLNALAPKVTGQGADQIAAMINQTFAKTLTNSALSIASTLVDNLGKPEASAKLTQFNNNIGELASTLDDSAVALQAYSSITNSAQTLLSAATDMMDTANAGESAASDQLKSTKNAVNDLSSALDTSIDALSQALASSSASFGALSTQIESTLSNVDDLASTTSQQIRSQSNKVNTQAQAYQQIRDRLASFEQQLPAGSHVVLNRILNQIDRLIAQQKKIAQDLEQSAQDLDAKISTNANKRNDIKTLSNQAKASIDSISTDFNTSIKPELKSMNVSFTNASQQLNTSAATLKGTVNDLSKRTKDSNTQLAKAHALIDDSAKQLTEASSKLNGFKDRLSKALQTGDMGTVKEVLGNNPDTLAALLAAPVSLHRKAVFPVANFGTAMTPFYTFLPLWVGSLLLGVTLKPTLSKKRREQLGNPKPHQIYWGHYGVYAIIALLQSTFSCAGSLLFLRVQAVHPLLFMLSGWLSSIIFSFFIYTLVMSFANVGKAIGVLFLVMQISGANGAYPLVMLPHIISDISPFLPVTYSVDMMRAAIAGIYNNDFWIAAGKICLFIPPLVLIGLVLRKPLLKFNTWYVKKVESTHLLN